jgi:2-iminobutanoate/2-iminopropanoate deaminase
MSPAVGPYNPARRAGDWVITSGQVGLTVDESGAPALAEGGTVGQLHQALRNLTDVLATEGATLADVVKTTLFLIDMADFGAVNEVWVEYFADPALRPTRSAVAVAALPVGARVEVEAWAYAPAR